jgi:hypothetical protein
MNIKELKKEIAKVKADYRNRINDKPDNCKNCIHKTTKEAVAHRCYYDLREKCNEYK